VSEATKRSRWRRWSPWIGGAVGIAALVWVLQGIDYRRLVAIVGSADARFLALVPIAIALEQIVRAWKWRQLLHPMRPVPTPNLFGAIMAGYLANLAVPLGVAGPVLRAWLAARRHDLKTSAVLATVVLDRLIDGVVFATIALTALILLSVPDAAGGLRAGMGWGAAGSLLLFVVLLATMAAYRLQTEGSARWLVWLIGRLPRRIAEPARKLAQSFAKGIGWPAEHWRGVGIVVASLVMKLIATTHFLWAGLAIGVLLRPGDYVVLLVFLGFLHVVAQVARIAAGFTVGAVFALGLLGVGNEEALIMVLIVQGASLLTVAIVGAAALWVEGIDPRKVRVTEEEVRVERG